MFIHILAMLVIAQGPPSTQLIIADLNEEMHSIANPRILDLPKGYNNQPHFIDNDTFLFTAIYDGQADIYKYHDEQVTRLTYTQESEYSPTLMPNGREYSVIRVEADGTQRLYAFPLKGGVPRMLLPTIKPVGYHLWLSPTELALFVLGQPMTLQRANLKSEKGRIVMNNVGRCFSRIPDSSNYSAVRLSNDAKSNHEVVSIDPENHEIQALTQTLPGSQDYVWTSKGHLLMAQNTKLHAWKGSGDWLEIDDLSHLGIGNITRMARSKNGKHLILVADLKP